MWGWWRGVVMEAPLVLGGVPQEEKPLPQV